MTYICLLKYMGD